jgi:hypothetical protein
MWRGLDDEAGGFQKLPSRARKTKKPALPAL